MTQRNQQENTPNAAIDQSELSHCLNNLDKACDDASYERALKALDELYYFDAMTPQQLRSALQLMARRVRTDSEREAQNADDIANIDCTSKSVNWMINKIDALEQSGRHGLLKEIFNDRTLVKNILCYGNLAMTEYLFKNQKMLGITQLLRDTLINTHGGVIHTIWYNNDVVKLKYLTKQCVNYRPANWWQLPPQHLNCHFFIGPERYITTMQSTKAMFEYYKALDPSGRALLSIIQQNPFEARYFMYGWLPRDEGDKTDQKQAMQELSADCECKWQLLDFAVYYGSHSKDNGLKKQLNQNRQHEDKLKERNFFINAFSNNDDAQELKKRFGELSGNDGTITRPNETAKRLCLSRQEILVDALVRSHKTWQKRTLLRRAVEQGLTNHVKTILDAMQWLTNDPAQLKHVLLHQGRHLVMDMIQYTPECLPQLLALCKEAKDCDMVLRTLLDYGRRSLWWQGARENALLHIAKNGIKLNSGTAQQDSMQLDSDLDVAPQHNSTSAEVIETLFSCSNAKLLKEWLQCTAKNGNPLVEAVNSGNTAIACEILNLAANYVVKIPSKTNMAAGKRITNDGANVIDKAETGAQKAASAISSSRESDEAADSAGQTMIQQTTTLWELIKDSKPHGLGMSLETWVNENFNCNSKDNKHRWTFTGGDGESKTENPEELELEDLDEDYEYSACNRKQIP